MFSESEIRNNAELATNLGKQLKAVIQIGEFAQEVASLIQQANETAAQLDFNLQKLGEAKIALDTTERLVEQAEAVMSNSLAQARTVAMEAKDKADAVVKAAEEKAALILQSAETEAKKAAKKIADDEIEHTKRKQEWVKQKLQAEEHLAKVNAARKAALQGLGVETD